MKVRVRLKDVDPVSSAMLNREIREQCVEVNAEYELELDALYLWTLHEDFGFGKIRLTRVYESMMKKRKELHDRYQPEHSIDPAGDADIEHSVAYHRLLDYGFDVHAEYERLRQKYGIRRRSGQLR